MTATSKMICQMFIFMICVSFNVGTTTPSEIVEMMSVIRNTLLIKPAHDAIKYLLYIQLLFFLFSSCTIMKLK